MHRRVLTAVLAVALPVVVTAETHVDVNRHKEFSRYKTFTLEVAQPIGADGVADEHNTLAVNRLRQAITREFQARGLEATDGPSDLTVHVSSRETERTAVLSSGWPGYPWGRYGRRGYWGYGGFWGPYAGDVPTRRYLEGSLTIDVIEAETGELVYRARVTHEIGDDLDKRVTKAVDKAFKKFPVREVSAQ